MVVASPFANFVDEGFQFKIFVFVGYFPLILGLVFIMQPERLDLANKGTPKTRRREEADGSGDSNSGLNFQRSHGLGGTCKR